MSSSILSLPNIDHSKYRKVILIGPLAAVFFFIVFFHGPAIRTHTPLSSESQLLNNAAPPLLIPPYHLSSERAQFAYVQYATEQQNLCNSLIIFQSLNKIRADALASPIRADLVLIYPREWDNLSASQAKIHGVMTRMKEMGVVMNPVAILSTQHGDYYWSKSLTKLLAFSLTAYRRIIVLDSDALLLKSLDHLFFLPMCTVAMPRAYWLEPAPIALGAKDLERRNPPEKLGSHFLVLQPSVLTMEYVRKIVNERLVPGFDMEIFEYLARGSGLIIPHRSYALLTGEFRSLDHSRYLRGNVDVKWDAQAEYDLAHLVHFSDWPLPKPWFSPSEAQMQDVQPACPQPDSPDGGCIERRIWTGIYEEWRNRRKEAQC